MRSVNGTDTADSSAITQADVFAAYVAQRGDPEECPAHPGNAVVSTLFRRGRPRYVFSSCGCVWDSESKSLRTP